MVWRNCKKIEETGVVARKEGSVRPKSVRKEERIKLVENWFLAKKISQELILYQQKLHVNLIMIVNQRLTDSNTKKCMIRSGKLPSNYAQKTLQTAFLNDEKIFNVKQLFFVPVDFGIWGLLEQNV